MPLLFWLCLLYHSISCISVSLYPSVPFNSLLPLSYCSLYLSVPPTLQSPLSVVTSTPLSPPHSVLFITYYVPSTPLSLCNFYPFVSFYLSVPSTPISLLPSFAFKSLFPLRPSVPSRASVPSTALCLLYGALFSVQSPVPSTDSVPPTPSTLPHPIPQKV